MTSPLLFPTTYVAYIRHSPILFGTRGSIPTAYHNGSPIPWFHPTSWWAASQSIPTYYCINPHTVYLYSTIAPHVVLLGIVFWMAGEAELSTEISSSVDGFSYSAFALCSFAATYCIYVHTTYHVGKQHHGIYAAIIQSQVHTVDRLQSQ